VSFPMDRSPHELSAEEKKNEDELNNIFFKLQNYTNIIAHENDEQEIDALLKYIDDDEYIIVNLSISPVLKERFMKTYSVEKLPILISYSTNIYNDENVDAYLKERKVNEDSFIDHKIDKMVGEKKVMVFIKGSPDKPECKFTKELISHFDELQLKNGKDYSYFNIKLDNKTRNRLKKRNNWPTFPQIYIDKLFVGGLDTFKKMKEKKIVQKMLFPGDQEEIE
ncbi:Glutaredoxin-related protein, partial [Trachipleistophora hominis]